MKLVYKQNTCIVSENMNVFVIKTIPILHIIKKNLEDIYLPFEVRQLNVCVKFKNQFVKHIIEVHEYVCVC